MAQAVEHSHIGRLAKIELIVHLQTPHIGKDSSVEKLLVTPERELLNWTRKELEREHGRLHE